ncbi:hypothetical protein JTE90_016778 [Oedothorax gibbosus]|uniref:Uncharacterized protein n=1 Tax=Oedothorax gibbosus TaxID=931172 RepID=A0AAV6W0P5_9ARAC|nr:hypothetical protein JTE90_016778 [Oedothorax gibbosus]
MKGRLHGVCGGIAGCDADWWLRGRVGMQSHARPILFLLPPSTQPRHTHFLVETRRKHQIRLDEQTDATLNMIEYFLGIMNKGGLESQMVSSNLQSLPVTIRENRFSIMKSKKSESDQKA